MRRLLLPARLNRLCELNVIRQVMNVAADDVSSDLPTAELLKRFYSSVPVKRKLGEFETLLSNEKIKRLLGFKPAYNWRMQVK